MHWTCDRLCREKQAVENMLTTMSSVVQRHKKQLDLRRVCCGEQVWKSQLNYSMAVAHLALLYQGLDQLHQLHAGALQQRLTCKIEGAHLLHPFCIFLAIHNMTF